MKYVDLSDGAIANPDQDSTRSSHSRTLHIPCTQREANTTSFDDAARIGPALWRERLSPSRLESASSSEEGKVSLNVRDSEGRRHGYLSPPPHNFITPPSESPSEGLGTLEEL